MIAASRPGRPGTLILNSALAMFALAGVTPFVWGAANDGALPASEVAPAVEPKPEDREKIERAIPRRAWAEPLRRRRLLIFDRNVGYAGHASIPHANFAFRRMGELTGAFECSVTRDPAAFSPDSLKQFDAVFCNNTVGNLFQDAELRRSLAEFIYSGGGLMGVHGTTVAFTDWPGAREDWPEFGLMLGARGASHRDSDELVFLRLDDPSHPLNAGFEPAGFSYRDEIFRVHEPYSRDRVRVLLSIDTERTDMNQGQPRGNCTRADGDYAVAWVRGYGRGRVFYSSIAHNPSVFWDERMLSFYLAAAQFALGDLPASTTPSARRTAGEDARERLGWRLSRTAGDSPAESLLAASEVASRAGLRGVGARWGQAVDDAGSCRIDDHLRGEHLAGLRLQLDALGVRIQTLFTDRVPADETAETLFATARRLGAELLVAEEMPASLETVERLAEKYELRLAVLDRSASASPEEVRRLWDRCLARGPRIGIYGQAEAWRRGGIDPQRAAGELGSRLFALQLNAPRMESNRVESSSPHPLPDEAALKEIAERELRLFLFVLRPPADPSAGDEEPDYLAALDQLCVRLAASQASDSGPAAAAGPMGPCP